MKRVLLIDSDPETRKRTTDILELGGYKVEIARQGKEGLRKAEVLKPDLIISRIKLKGGDGFSILYSIRQNKHLGEIPFFLIAENGKRGDWRRAMEMGADDFIADPFKDVELLKSVENQIKRYEFLKETFSHQQRGKEDFNCSDEPWLRILIQDRKIEKYREGDHVFLNGNSPAYVFYLVEGKVKLFYLDEKGREFIPAIVRPGQLFGYRAILENRSYDQNCSVMSPARIVRIPAREFMSILQNDTSLATGLLKVLSVQLSKQEKNMLSLSYYSVQKRVRLKLRMLYQQTGKQSIDISRSDLASLAGTTAETVVRILSALREEGILETHGHTIMIKKPGKL